MIVLDASAVVALLLGTPGSAAVAAAIAPVEESLHAPNLLSVEVSQVLRRYERAGALRQARGRQALADLVDLGVDTYDHEPLLQRVWALRHNLTAYDAVYVALAEALGAPLLTLDERLAAAPGHRARVLPLAR